MNLRKHGVDFVMATKAFIDPYRKIYVDEKDRQREKRYFCLGKVKGRVLTVRFTYRGGLIRIYGAGYRRGGRRYYEQKEA